MPGIGSPWIDGQAAGEITLACSVTGKTHGTTKSQRVADPLIIAGRSVVAC